MIVFYSNFINEHQIPFCKAMYKKTNGNFKFVATQPISEERLAMGFEDQSDKFSFVLKAFESRKKYLEALKLGEESEVVILGDAGNEYIEKRLMEGKLTFRYSERFFKEGYWRLLDPRVLLVRYRNDIRFRHKNFHMLCASAYTAQDCRLIHAYPNKVYKWGYFPEVKKYSDIVKMIESKYPASILWAGRLIEWKHPEVVIEVAEKLRKNGYKFDINMIGEGEKEVNLRKMIKDKELEDYVHLHGFMPPEQVREWMEHAEIYLFTSDRNEGWGAVLNESLNSACAVVANEEIGSVPYLIQKGVNGYTYNQKKKDDLFNKVKCLLDCTELRQSMQQKAYETMLNTWNADSASERLLNLIECLRKGKEVEYDSGPCSRD
ncbi:MAG: glycosyltransferase family 4 protein [Anaerobutyricum sp.]